MREGRHQKIRRKSLGLENLSLSLPYQLDQVLELIRLRVEIVNQKGLELLCEGDWFERWRRRRGRAREGGEKETDEESILQSLSAENQASKYSIRVVPRSSGYLSRGGMARSFCRACVSDEGRRASELARSERERTRRSKR